MKNKIRLMMKKLWSLVVIVLWIAWVVSPVPTLVAVMVQEYRIEKLENRVNSLYVDQDQPAESTRSITYSPSPVETSSTVDYSSLYPPTDGELEILAKILYREARGVTDKAQQAAVVWCILNRVDDEYWGDTIEQVATYPNAFAWVPDTPVEEELMLLVSDVCERWNLEKSGVENVGRTLPKEYLYFTGDGERNNFTKEWRDSKIWDWSLPSPY